MTPTAAERVAVLGTGLIGTSIAMAPRGWGATWPGGSRSRVLALAAERGSVQPPAPWKTRSLEPPSIICPGAGYPRTRGPGPVAAPDAVVTDAGSIKEYVVREVTT
jgi:prephenate dehydrogenase